MALNAPRTPRRRRIGRALVSGTSRNVYAASNSIDSSVPRSTQTSRERRPETRRGPRKLLAGQRRRSRARRTHGADVLDRRARSVRLAANGVGYRSSVVRYNSHRRCRFRVLFRRVRDVATFSPARRDLRIIRTFRP